MNASDPNASVLELVASALGSLREDLVLVGGCSVGLLITDRARPPVRQTIDVDVVTEVTSIVDYYATADRLRQCGFRESHEANNMCRWRNGELILDLMPSDESVLGHSTNRWYTEAVRSAQKIALPSGKQIRLIAPAVFIATKLASFNDRGGGDYTHHDMEDIVNVIDGRPELIGEVSAAPEEVRNYIRAEVDGLLADQTFFDALPWLLLGDQANQARLPLIVDRLRALAGL